MTAPRIRATATVLMAIAVAAGVLASCGKKEPLKQPAGSTYPRQYPPPPKPDAKVDGK